MFTVQHAGDRPLVLLTPKYLHHHRPATSALHDMTSGTFFNRVIDDGKVTPPCSPLLLLCTCYGKPCRAGNAFPPLQGSDNTRHRSHHPATGEPYLLPPHRIRRVILCTGQMYYRLRCACAHSQPLQYLLGPLRDQQSAAGTQKPLCGILAATRAERQRSETS